MPRVSEQHLAARRRQILDAAVALFSERGFARTSMSDVVRESGLSMGAVYRYFPSKVDLVIAAGEGHGGDVDGEFPAERARDLLTRLAVERGPGGSHARFSIQVVTDEPAGPPCGGLYLKPPSEGGLCEGVMTMPSARPCALPREALCLRIACESTGVGV